MVEVARVLATDPSILLLDEPFGALDAQTRARMQDALAQLWEERRKTVLFLTHDAEEALYLADRILVLSQRPGRVKAQFTWAFRGRARSRPFLRRIPFTQAPGLGGYRDFRAARSVAPVP